MFKFSIIHGLVVVGMLSLGVSTAQACEGDGQSAERAHKTHAGTGKRHCGPPAEALAACEGLAAATQCSFTGRRDETLTGQCREIRDGSLACVPEGHMRRHPSGEQQ